MSSIKPLAEEVSAGKDSQSSVGHLIDASRCILDQGSRKDAQEALKALCAIYNLRVVSAFVPIGTPQATAARVSRVNRNPQAKAYGSNPRMKEIKDKIRDLNRRISAKSLLTGAKLPMEDELLIQRSQLFRDLKGSQNKAFDSVQAGQGPKA